MFYHMDNAHYVVVIQATWLCLTCYDTSRIYGRECMIFAVYSYYRCVKALSISNTKKKIACKYIIHDTGYTQ